MSTGISCFCFLDHLTTGRDEKQVEANCLILPQKNRSEANCLLPQKTGLLIDLLWSSSSKRQDFNSQRSLRSISTVLPQGALELDPRTNKLKKSAQVPVGAPPVLPLYEALAPGPSLAPAPAPGPGGPRHHFDGESRIGLQHGLQNLMPRKVAARGLDVLHVTHVINYETR